MPVDTIFALATPPGRSGVAVIRVSGGQAGAILDAASVGPRPDPRRAVLRTLIDHEGGTLDRALVLWFPGPASFTGEDCAEFHIHGGPAVMSGLIDRLLELGGRPAEAGEFTRRAFEHGRMDLTEAEGLADLIDSETPAQRQQALAQMNGVLRDLYEAWRAELISVLAMIEGEIDFPDEDDVPDALATSAGSALEALIAALSRHLDDNRRGERIRKGFSIAIIGPPNTGKSSLLNAIAGRDAAIVTDIPGTTRDIVEVAMVLGGFAVTLADTAGLRDTQDVIESEGVRRALTRADSADLVVGVLDGSGPRNQDMTPVLEKSDIIVLGKSDLPRCLTLPDSRLVNAEVSAKTGSGVEALIESLTEKVHQQLGASEAPALTRARHRRKVGSALEALRRAHDKLDFAELAGDDVRLAVRALEELTGRIDVEEVLGEIFSRFCIGK
ncbi:MAG: tRNA modification GTPase MnmE [Hyphobacterium sp.]|nr:MAG: tRNA modification GTPase MnmE [Hyphobacterium sp.]